MPPVMLGVRAHNPLHCLPQEISKSNVVDDMVASNSILYKPGEHPDHVVVIKYVPYVADSKRAMDEYTSEIFMGGKNTIVMHNTCEDRCAIRGSLLKQLYVCCTGPGCQQLHSCQVSTPRPVSVCSSALLPTPLPPAPTAAYWRRPSSWTWCCWRS